MDDRYKKMLLSCNRERIIHTYDFTEDSEDGTGG